MAEDPQAASEVDADRVAELIEAGEADLIDVRRSEEYADGHIEGARHVEFADLQAEAASLERERPVIFYCQSGGRSATAAEAFRLSGFDARNLAGGLDAWGQRDRPVRKP